MCACQNFGRKKEGEEASRVSTVMCVVVALCHSYSRRRAGEKTDNFSLMFGRQEEQSGGVKEGISITR